MLYWAPIEVRAYLRRWTVLKAIIATLMLLVPELPPVQSLLSDLGVFRSVTMLAWYAIAGSTWLWGCGDYARSKGYSGWWGLLCAPLPLGPFGLFVLFLMPDRWDTRHSDWRFEADPLLIDGHRMISAKEARGMLKISAKGKLVTAGILWIAVLALTLIGAKQVSLLTRDTMLLLALGLGAIASFSGIWGSAHLARRKGYQTYWAGAGFFALPIVMYLVLTGAGSFAIVALTLVAFLLGPVVVLLLPDQWSDVGISPMSFNPNEMRDTVEAQYIELPSVRIINTY